ncbi:MAG TPA: GNAT family N-acetyltransferase [Pseudonocardiaceae bacterium]|jgi:GNAT superfamily N-acetyltransferase
MLQRPVTIDDLPVLLDLFHRSEQAELGEPYSSAADLRNLLTAPGLDLPTRTMAIEENGQLNGFAALYPAPNQSALRAWLVVGPERPTEVADPLLDLIDSWADADHDPSTPEVNAYQYANALAGPALTAHGWRIVHSNTRLVIDLAAPGVPLPGVSFTANPRIRVRVAVEDAGRRVAHALLEDAIARDWNHQRREFGEFIAAQQARPGYDEQLWFIADLDDEPAGVLIARDPESGAWVAWLGVSERSRGNGVAKHLLLTAFDTFRARGRRTVGVDTDTHNATDAVRVYEKAGMVSEGTADAWARELHEHSGL